MLDLILWGILGSLVLVIIGGSIQGICDALRRNKNAGGILEGEVWGRVFALGMWVVFMVVLYRSVMADAS